jgi:hypothetical protein
MLKTFFPYVLTVSELIKHKVADLTERHAKNTFYILAGFEVLIAVLMKSRTYLLFYSPLLDLGRFFSFLHPLQRR